MKRLLILLILIIPIFALVGCERALMPDDCNASPQATFEYLWQQVDRQYALFDVKHVDWQRVYDTMAPKIYNGLSNAELFALLGDMLNTLDDGHVNLISDDDISRSEEVFLQMYQRYSIDIPTLQLYYLGPDAHTTGGLVHNLVDSIIYIRYSSFSNDAGQFAKVVRRYPGAKGIVLDLRQNGGGNIDNIWKILKCYPSHGQLLYNTQIKSGPAHNDFGAPQPVYAPEPIDHPIALPTAVLIDRGAYSATSFFALCARQYPCFTLIGDTTGGGLGLPNGGGLPNGWYYRLSVTRTLDPAGTNYENGVPPHIVTALSPDAIAQHHDNIIDTAIAILKNLD